MVICIICSYSQKLDLTVATLTPCGIFTHVNVTFVFGHVALTPTKAPLKGAVALPATIHVTIKFPLGAADTCVQGP